MKPKITYQILLASTFFAICSMVLLFIFSEDIIHHQNNFIRRFPNQVTKAHQIDLRFNSYYLAGTTGNKIYLGNYTAPLLITVIDTALKTKKEFNANLSNINYPFQSVQVRVVPPNFYVVDGTVPIIFKGKIKDWKASVKWHGSVLFSRFELIDSLTIACRSIKNPSGESVLGTLYFGNPAVFNLNYKLLQKQIDGIFDVDGTLQYDPQLKRLVYVYLYRNQFIVADKRLNLDYRGKTIDTVHRAQIEVAYLANTQEKKLAAPPLIVNKISAVYKNLLFVNSGLPGRYEDDKMWKEASIIDVYDLNDKSYISSFYIYDISNKKLKSFFVRDNHLYGFVGQYLVDYKFTKLITDNYSLNKTL